MFDLLCFFSNFVDWIKLGELWHFVCFYAYMVKTPSLFSRVVRGKMGHFEVPYNAPTWNNVVLGSNSKVMSQILLGNIKLLAPWINLMKKASFLFWNFSFPSRIHLLISHLSCSFSSITFISNLRVLFLNNFVY